MYLGIYDMSGNVWEWCEDVYDSNAYSKHARNNPVVTSGGSARVRRGGSWYSNPGGVRAANRHGHTPGYRNGRSGARRERTWKGGPCLTRCGAAEGRGSLTRPRGFGQDRRVVKIT